MIIKADELLEQLKLISIGLPRQDINPVLSCFKFSKDKIVAYNGVIYVDANIKGIDFEVIVNAKLLMDILTGLTKHTIELFVSDKILNIKSGKFIANITSIDLEQSSQFAYNTKKEFKTEIKINKDVLQFVKNIVDTDMSVGGRKGIYLYGDKAICVDGGYRLFKFKISGDIVNFIPSEVIDVLIFTKKHKLYFNGKNFKVVSDNISFYISEYNPNSKVNYEEHYKKFNAVKSIKLKMDKLAKSLDKIAIIANASLDNTCILSYQKGSLVIAAKDDRATVEDKVKIESIKDFEILVNFNYLQELLKFSTEIYFAQYKDDSGLLYAKNGDSQYFIVTKILS